MKKDFTLDKLKELTNKAIEPYLVSIEQALQSPLSQDLTREQQAQMVEQMFTRSLRLVNFAFFKEVNSYVDNLVQADVKKEKAKQEKATSSNNPKKATLNQKKTLKELRERRAKHGEAELREERAKKINPNQES